MAESAALTAVINQAAEIGANLIVETGSRLYNLKENIEWIAGKMRHFQSCLKDAESKQDGRNEVANLINDMRELALDIEDILRTYLPEIASHEGKGTFQCLKHAACILCYGGTANSFALEIERIRRRAQEIEAARERCQVNAERDRGNADMDVWDLRKKFLDAPDSMVVGREEILQELKEKLRSSNSECKVICVVGEAGVGKTTIGKKIYREMLNEFTSAAIIHVSKDPIAEKLLLDIAKQVGLEEEKIKENLEVNLRSLLNEKKCLIFLDDIWSIEAWDKFKNVIRIHSRRSRTIITSRYTDVGRYIGGESSLVELRILDKEKSWELFSKLIKSSSENTNERFLSIVLEDIARKIIERCGGLPLAIEVAVGMLRQRRRNEDAWNEVLDNLNTSAGNICSEMLSLSYKDLSPDLRPFLLYFGLFPKDQEISASELVKAWVAEKLIRVDGIRNPVDIGAAKLEMLSDRNLIQVSKRNWNGRVKSCRIHDLLHVLCINMAKENNFFSTCHNIDPSSFSTLRRLTIDNTSQYSFSNSKTPKLRSLLYFNNSGEIWFLIPDEIGNLSNLTYLKLSGKFKKMPSSIRNLKKLLTLDIQQAFFYCDLPRTILRMKCLKHLLMLYTTKIANFCVGNTMYLPNIEILVGLNGDVFKASSLQNLSNLRKLSIRFVNDQFIDVIFGKTPISKKLQDLQLTSILQPVKRLNMSHYDHLAKLHLHFVDSSRVKLDIIEFPPNLINLTLENMEFLEDPMEVLKTLPKLEILRMNNCVYSSVKLDFSGANSFPELQVLAIFNDFLMDSPEWIVDETGMPKLYKLVCDVKYLNLPERISKIMVEPLSQTSIEEE